MRARFTWASMLVSSSFSATERVSFSCSMAVGAFGSGGGVSETVAVGEVAVVESADASDELLPEVQPRRKRLPPANTAASTTGMEEKKRVAKEKT